MKTHLIITAALAAFAVWAGQAGAALPAQRNVEVIVNSSLYASGDITDSLDQYLLDIRAQGYAPTLTTTAFANAADLRAHLANRYATDGLAGAVFVGDIPRANYEIAAHGVWSAETFPVELYFQDLDGTWVDADSDGKYDDHTGSVAPEIWLGRLATDRLTSLHEGRTEAGMLNDYFAKNHAYRRGNLSTSNNGLAYIDDDWSASAPGWASAMQGAVDGTVTTVNVETETNAADYEYRLANESYEHLLLAAHSNSAYHLFKSGGGGSTYASELAGLNPNVLFYNLFACSAAKFTVNGFLAGEYVFGTDTGLLSVGSAKTGSMLAFEQYFSPLGDGATFGDAWRGWFNFEATGGFNPTEKDWSYGMTMIGDPLLMSQEFQPFLVWADFDGDGDADADDIELLRQNIMGGDRRYDVNGDGLCRMDDMEMMIDLLVEWAGPAEQGVGTAMGDFNLDGVVDTTDLTILATNFGSQATWAEGNANYDPMIDTTDLTILATNFGSQATSAAIPEPASMCLLACGAIGLLRRRRNG